MQAFAARQQNGSREASERANSRQSRSQRVAVGENANFANFDLYAPPVLGAGGEAPAY